MRQRITFALVVLAAGNLAFQWAASSPNLVGHGVTLGLAVLAFVFSRLRLWRVRNRLLVSYFLFGVVPLALVLVLVAVTATTIFGLIAADRVRRAVADRTRETSTLAGQIATVIASQPETDASVVSRLVTTIHPTARAIVNVRDRLQIVSDDTGPLPTIPAWSSPGFSGLIEAAGHYFNAGHARDDRSGVDVFVYLPFTVADLGTIRGAAAVVLVPSADDINVNDRISVAESQVTLERGGVRIPIAYSAATGLPPKRALWDPVLGWAVREPVRRSSGESGQLLLTFVSRPSLLMPLLADPSDLGPRILVALAVILGGTIAVAIAGSVFWSARLTRSITRAVHDLYEGTRAVASGNLDHRIPVRGADQLSELASSFNAMTERVQQLIVDVGEKEKLESELAIARQVQLQQFPKAVPKLATLEVAALCIPSRFVSGDYYDYVPLPNGRLALALGDVSGKGISAALVMASLQSALHAQLRHGPMAGSPEPRLSTAALMAQLSEQIYENTPGDKYATFFGAIYDDRTGSLLYTNAGHLPPILIRGSEVIRLDVGGTVVGLMPIFSYEERVIELLPRDLVAIFSDGVTEAEDASGEQFGDGRLTDFLIAHKEKPLDEIVRLVTDRVRAWAHDPDNADDTTILLARRL